MPNLGFDAQEARLVEWLKEPGDSIQRGEAIALVESDKANVDLESVAAGILLERRFPEDSVIEIGTVIARVGTAEEYDQAPQPTPPSEAAAAGPGAADVDTPAEAQTAPQPTAEHGDALKALPKVRKQARELGVDLTQVRPGGADGVISMADVEAAAGLAGSSVSSGSDAGPAPATAEPLSRTRQAIAARMIKSVREAPHFSVSGEIDLEEALTILPEGVRINDLLLYLTVQALRDVPSLNAHFDGHYLTRYPQIDLSMAVATGDGLLTPTLPGAEAMSLSQLAEAGRSLIDRARSGRQRSDDLQPGTFTVSNLGISRRVDRFTAVINPPQVAILAAGAAKQRPVVRNGGLYVRTTVNLSLSGDHRVVDGIDLARFLDAFQAHADSLGEQ